MEQPSQTVMALRISRGDGDSLPVSPNGFIQVALACEGVTQAGVNVRVVRAQRAGRHVVADRFLEAGRARIVEEYVGQGGVSPEVTRVGSLNEPPQFEAGLATPVSRREPDQDDRRLPGRRRLL